MTVAQVAYSTFSLRRIRVFALRPNKMYCLFAIIVSFFAFVVLATRFIFLFSAPPKQFTLVKMFYNAYLDDSFVRVYSSVEPLNVICFPFTLQFALQQHQHGRGLDVSSLRSQHLIWFSIFRLSFPMLV